jgi:hypothetical protein
MSSSKTLYAQWVGGVIAKSCFGTGPIDGTGATGFSSWAFKNVYRDNTNNTMTSIVTTQYSNGFAAPYGTGNALVDNAHIGSILNSYSKAVLYQVAGVYQIDINYKTEWMGTLPSGAPQSEPSIGFYNGTIILGSTYWPTTQTINDITLTTTGLATMQFSISATPTTVPQTYRTIPVSGCFSDSINDVTVIPNINVVSQVIEFYINFSDTTSTRVAVSIQAGWSGATSPYTLVFNRTRVELANGPPSNPGITTASLNVPLP